MKRLLLILPLICLASTLTLAQPKREMRAVWIATVENIDWPRKGDTDPLSQQRDMIAILDRLQQLRINTIFIQIRPTADAFYESIYEPWSKYLTGKQGQMPEPFYEPLEFIINEAHKRCINVHAWMNPYRASRTGNTKELSPNHLYFYHPELFITYGNKKDGQLLWMDPGRDETRTWINKIVADVVTRYDIDGIHFDDYFYPYKIAGKDFPDNHSFEQSPRGFSKEQKADWRRNNVNMVIAELQQTIKNIKPWVEFGISPFGRIETNYNQLYADVQKWLQEGWIDYIVPQIYWEIGHRTADYTTLIQYWSNNTHGRNLYIGLADYKLADPQQNKPWNEGNEIIRQIALNRTQKNIKGVAFYSLKPMLNNPQGLLDSLTNTIYTTYALPPINKNLGDNPPPADPTNLKLQRGTNGLFLSWRPQPDASYYVIYAFKGKNTPSTRDPQNIVSLTRSHRIDLTAIPNLHGEYYFGITAVNRYHKESHLITLPTKTINF